MLRQHDGFTITDQIPTVTNGQPHSIESIGKCLISIRITKDHDLYPHQPLPNSLPPLSWSARVITNRKYFGSRSSTDLTRSLVRQLSPLAISAHHNFGIRTIAQGKFHHLGHSFAPGITTASQIPYNLSSTRCISLAYRRARERSHIGGIVDTLHRDVSDCGGERVEEGGSNE
jgi:hypothetical protein